MAKNQKSKLFTTCLIPTNENDNEQFITDTANSIPDEQKVLLLDMSAKSYKDNNSLEFVNEL